MDGVVSIDGVISALEAGCVPVLDRAFLYGDGVFEALRTYGGLLHALPEHLDRLLQSCATLGFEPLASREQLTAETLTALAACNGQEHYVRIMLSRGQGAFGLAPTGAGRSLRVVLVRPLPAVSTLLEVRGIRVESVTSPVSRCSAGAKASSYLTNLLALDHARRQGAEDALLLGDYGELLEGATSSVFVVRNGVLLTPTLALGILPGITRAFVIALARAQGLSVREPLLTIHDAYQAEELFLASSVRELVPVLAVDGARVGAGQPGPITQRLMVAYRSQALLEGRPAALPSS